MKSGKLSMTVLALAVAATLWAPSIAAQREPTGYRVVRLDGLGGNLGAGIGINNQGLVTGYATKSGNTIMRATAWVGSSVFDLGATGGAASNSAVIWPVKDDRGLIAGITETGEANPLGEIWSCGFFFPTITHQICRGFVWRNGAMTALPPFAGGYNSYASGVNNRGQVVGWAENGVYDSSCNAPQVLQFRAAIWGPHGQMQELLPFGDDTSTAATAINDQGQVVGISGLCADAYGGDSAVHAVLWQNGTVTNLGNLGTLSWNTPTAINNRGHVAGFALGVPSFGAFSWTPESGIQQLETLTGDRRGFAWGINEQDEIVGQSIGSISRAVIWRGGSVTNLNELVPPGSPRIEYANDINNRGEITGGACVVCNGSDPFAVKLIPVYDANFVTAGSAVQTQVVQSDGNAAHVEKQLKRRMASSR